MMSSDSAGEEAKSHGHPCHSNPMAAIQNKTNKQTKQISDELWHNPRISLANDASIQCASASLTKPDHLASLSIACATIQSAPHLACSIHSLPHSPGILLPYLASLQLFPPPPIAPVPSPPHAVQAPLPTVPRFLTFLFYSSSSPTHPIALCDAVLPLCPRARRGHAYHGTHPPPQPICILRLTCHKGSSNSLWSKWQVRLISN